MAKCLEIKIEWKEKELRKAFDESGNLVVACDRAYYRPLEVNNLLGDSKKARLILGWKPKIKLNELVDDMVKSELDRV